MDLLKGKTAIITGGAGGIGLSIAQRFHAEGASVVICDIQGDRLSQARAQISPTGEEVHAVQADVRVEEDIQRVVEERRRARAG